jgi:sigma-B regulation protein RsbU (phosphoserine phosphatase)
MGVDPGSLYAQREMDIASGQIIAIGTDGIWEAQNNQGEMFGKRRFQEVVRAHSGAPSREILSAVIAAVESFCLPLPRNDDLTLVVVKVKD